MQTKQLDLSRLLKDHLIHHCKADDTALKTIDYLISTGTLEKRQMLRVLVKLRYRELRRKQSHRSARLDCAIEFRVSESFVDNLIYHNSGIRV